MMILNPVGVMLTSSGLCFIHLRHVFIMKGSVSVLKSPTSIGSFVTNHRFSSDIGPDNEGGGVGGAVPSRMKM